MNPYKTNARVQHTIPPIAPSIVLLGEIFGASLCLPNNLPVKYANVSVDHAPINISKYKILPFSKFLVMIMLAKEIAMKTIAKKQRTISFAEIFFFVKTPTHFKSSNIAITATQIMTTGKIIVCEKNKTGMKIKSATAPVMIRVSIFIYIPP